MAIVAPWFGIPGTTLGRSLPSWAIHAVSLPPNKPMQRTARCAAAERRPFAAQAGRSRLSWSAAAAVISAVNGGRDRLMNRRAFIGGLILEALATLDVARAQSARKVYRIGCLASSGTTSSVQGPEPQAMGIRSLLRGLRELGWVYGEHFAIEARSGEGKLERFPALAAELVRLKVDVIVGPGPVLPALKQATSTIPVVMVGAAAPVSQGLVQSLARPGGNFTGLSLQLTETTGKRLGCSRSWLQVWRRSRSSGIGRASARSALGGGSIGCSPARLGAGLPRHPGVRREDRGRAQGGE
jgi:hypothetical protein